MTEAWIIDTVVVLYVATNSLRVFSYLPQIVAVAREGGAARAISLTTWLFWTLANASTAGYAAAVVSDRMFAAVSLGNTLGCLTVALIVLYKRHKYGRHPCDHAAASEATVRIASAAR